MCIRDRLRGVYNVQDTDFDLTQFGLFLSNDMLYMTFHMNEMVEIMGRRLMPGDVLELPHLRDALLLNADKNAINKYYVVNDTNRGAEGFSQTWYPHIWRVKLSPLTDSQEYYDILGDGTDANSLKNDISTYKAEYNISDAIVAAADAEDPNGTSMREHLFGYDHPTSGGIVNKDKTYRITVHAFIGTSSSSTGSKVDIYNGGTDTGDKLQVPLLRYNAPSSDEANDTVSMIIVFSPKSNGDGTLKFKGELGSGSDFIGGANRTFAILEELSMHQEVSIF